MSATLEFPSALPDPWLGERLARIGDRLAAVAAVLSTALAIALALYAAWALPVLSLAAGTVS